MRCRRRHPGRDADRLDRGRDALEVEDVVEPDAVVDVERRHAERAGRRVAGLACRRAGAGEDCGDERYEGQDGGDGRYDRSEATSGPLSSQLRTS